jgi:hypothetical protein
MSGVTETRPATAEAGAPNRRQHHDVWLLPVLGAVTVGLVSLLAHQYLPAGPDLIGHSAALWLAFAFFLGARSDRTVESIAAGGFGLIGVVFVYYGSLRLFMDRADFPTVEKFWFLAGVIGGPIYGAIGHLYRSRRAVPSGFAVAALAAVFIAEAANYRQLNDSGLALAVETAVGLALPLVLARGLRQALAALAWLPLLLLVGLTAFKVVDELFWQVG